MRSPEELTKEFMEKIKSGIPKENLPNNGPEVTREFVEKELENYDNLMDTELMKGFFSCQK